MKKHNDPFEGALDSLQDKTLPTNEQKEKMLNYVLMESRLQDNSILGKVGKWISVYPWRFAFSAAAAQAVVFTLIFGTEYTNLVLRMFGG
jgi:Zn/Cd-binding protein ZinT